MHILASFANRLIMTKILGPVAYFSGTFTAQNKSWCATEKEAYAVLKSVQCFDHISKVQSVLSTVTTNHWNHFLPGE